MKYRSPLIATLISLTPLIASAEVNYPNERNLVGTGDHYTLEHFGNWRVDCLREKDGQDICASITTLKYPKLNLDISLSITSRGISIRKSKADVDTLPYAQIKITATSSTGDDPLFPIGIVSVDGEPYDGYHCGIEGAGTCLIGSLLIRDDLLTLLNGRKSSIAIYDIFSDPEYIKEVDRVDIDLYDLHDAFDRANEFTAETHGNDLEGTVWPTEMCDMSIDGVQKRISYTYDKDIGTEKTTFRERIRGAKGKGSCPSYVTLSYLTPDLTNSQREMFCLIHDKDRDTITGFQQGVQNAYRVCKKPSRSFCERVNSTKTAAAAITGFASGSVGGAVGATSVTGTSVVMHSSGAAIITGSSGYIAGTLGTIGTTALGILTAPATISAAAISVIAVGGAVYVCKE